MESKAFDVLVRLVDHEDVKTIGARLGVGYLVEDTGVNVAIRCSSDAAGSAMKKSAALETLVVSAIVIGAIALMSLATRYWGSPVSSGAPPPIDRANIPLGPYRIDLSGVAGGSIGKDLVSINIVMRHGDVHFQKDAEVGKALDGAIAVTHLSISYKELDGYPASPSVDSGTMVDGLRLLNPPNKKKGDLDFEVPDTNDAYGKPIRVLCYFAVEDAEKIKNTGSFRDTQSGWCGAYYSPRPHLYVIFNGLPAPRMAGELSVFLPRVYELTSDVIRGER